jgi:uncharacterized protein (TIGR03083 family)
VSRHPTLKRVTATDSNPYAAIKAYEQAEFRRLSAYLESLDSEGWLEQSYCTDWLVFQVVSHLGSGSRIGGLRVQAWVGGGPAVTREAMQQVWAHFDALEPSHLYPSFSAAVRDYLAVEASTPDAAGAQEVDGFAGKRPLYAYQTARTWELACHSWDVYISRDSSARLDRAAVALLASGLHFINLPFDKERGAALSTQPIAFQMEDSALTYTLDPTAERPRVAQATDAGAAPLVITGPDEEIIRFVSGRHFIPGSRPRLEVARGTPQELAALRRAFR